MRIPNSGHSLKQLTKLLLAILILAGFQTAVQAQGIYLPTSGPVNRSMGGASTAAPVDAVGALYWNPAAISGLKESELGFGMDMLFVDLDLGSSFGGFSGSSESDSSVTPIPAIGWVQKLNETTTMGLGLGAVAGFSTNFPASSTSPIQFPQSLGGFGRIHTSAEFLQVTPVLSMQLTEFLAIGVGPVVTLGKLHVDPFVFAAPDNANGMGPAAGTYPLGSGSRYHYGLGAQIGLYYSGLQDITLGASVKSTQFMEQFRFQSQDENGAQRYLKFDLDLPMIVSLGAAYHGMENTILAIDLRYFDYKNTQGFGDAGFTADGALKGLSWQNVFSMSIGGRKRLCEKLTVGAGYQYNTNPIRDSDTGLNIASPLYQQHTFHTGMTIHMTDQVDVSMAYTYIADAEITGPILTAPAGGGAAVAVPGSSVTSSLAAHLISMGVSVRY
jgi:long-chain fatty acid transport protein